MLDCYAMIIFGTQQNKLHKLNRISYDLKENNVTNLYKAFIILILIVCNLNMNHA